MVTNILGLIAGGYTQEQILQTYPELAREDIAAALEYASQVVEEHLTQDETKRAELHHDLDDLTGSWSADVAAAFDEALARQRTIGSSG